MLRRLRVSFTGAEREHTYASHDREMFLAILEEIYKSHAKRDDNGDDGVRPLRELAVSSCIYGSCLNRLGIRWEGLRSYHCGCGV